MFSRSSSCHNWTRSEEITFLAMPRLCKAQSKPVSIFGLLFAQNLIIKYLKVHKSNRKTNKLNRPEILSQFAGGSGRKGVPTRTPSRKESWLIKSNRNEPIVI